MYGVRVYSNLIDLHMAIHRLAQILQCIILTGCPQSHSPDRRQPVTAAPRTGGCVEGHMKQSPLCILLDRGG